MTPRPGRTALVVVLLTLAATTAVRAQPGPYAGRPLAEVLTELGRDGLRLMFSTRVVLPDMRVRSEPRSTSPRQILDEILAPHGLCVVNGPGDRLLVVRAPVVRPAPRVPPATSPPTGAVTIGFRHRESGRPLSASSVILTGEGGTAAVSPEGRIVIRGLSNGLHYLETAIGGFVNPEARAFSVTTDGAVDLVIDLEPLPHRDREALSVLPLVHLLVSAGVRHRETTDVVEPAGRASVEQAATRLSAAVLVGTPGTLGNPLRTVQTVPGVVSGYGFDGRLVVRGGAPSENLFLVDGVESFSPYRLFGLASALVPGTVESIDLFRAGFDVRHGDRLSSVLHVNQREGRRDTRVGGAGSLGLLDTDLLLEGSLPRAWNGSWLVAGRYSFFDMVAATLFDHRMPSNADLVFKLALSPRPGRRVSLFGTLGDERLDARVADNPGEGYDIRTRGRTVLAAMRVDTTLGTHATLSTAASFSGVLDRFDFGGRVQSDALGTSGLTHGVDSQIATVDCDKHATVRDWALRQDFSWEASPRHALDAGFEAHALTTSWAWTIAGDTSEDVMGRMLPWPYAMPAASLPSALDSRLSYARAGAWIQFRPAIDRWLAPQVGMRVDYSGLTRDVEMSPRASVAVAIGTTTRLSTAVGLYRQSPGYEKQVVSDYFVDLSQADRLQSERALHAVTGIEHRFAPGLIVRAEAYRKWYTNLLIGRLETAEEHAARLATYDFGALSSELPTERLITSVPSNDGRGRSLGIDVEFEKTPLSGDPRWTVKGSYSYGHAERAIHGEIVPFDYDRRHVVNLLTHYQLRPSIGLSFTLRVASGAPYTAALGLRVAPRADVNDADADGNRTELIPAHDSFGNLIYRIDFGGLSNLNRARLPSYVRADGRLTYSPRGPSGRWSLYLDIINLLNDDDIGLVTYNVAEVWNWPRPVINRSVDYAIPFLPSVGMRFRF